MLGPVNTPAERPASVYVFAPRAPPRTSVIPYAVLYVREQPRGGARPRAAVTPAVPPQPAVPAVPQETRWTFTADDVPMPVTLAVFVPFRNRRPLPRRRGERRTGGPRAVARPQKWLGTQFAARGRGRPDGVVTAWRRAHALPLRWRGGVRRLRHRTPSSSRMEAPRRRQRTPPNPRSPAALLEAVLPSPRPFRDDPTALDGTLSVAEKPRPCPSRCRTPPRPSRSGSRPGRAPGGSGVDRGASAVRRSRHGPRGRGRRIRHSRRRRGVGVVTHLGRTERLAVSSMGRPRDRGTPWTRWLHPPDRPRPRWSSGARGRSSAPSRSR